MTKEFLKACLAEGLSLEQIGDRAGRHPSTVSYHLKKHGLKPPGHAVHAPNAKVEPDRLRELVKRGATLREAAAEFEVGYSTIRHWIKRLGLETQRMGRLRESTAAIRSGLTEVGMECPRPWGRHVRQAARRKLSVLEMPDRGRK